MKSPRILLTGVGAPGTSGTLMCIRKAFPGSYIVGVDMDSECSYSKKINPFYTVPSGSSGDYKLKLLEIANKERVELIVPQTDGELLPLAEINEDQSPIPAIMVSSRRSIEETTNKRIMYAILESSGFPAPRYRVAGSILEIKRAAIDLGYPDKDVFVKPSISSGSRGCIHITKNAGSTLSSIVLEKRSHVLKMTLEQLEQIHDDGSANILGKYGGLVVTEHFCGSEFSVDCFRDFSTDTFLAIPRRRDKIVNGISFKNTIVNIPEIISLSIAFSEIIDIDGVFGLQFIMDSFGVPKLIECNPRIQGTMAASAIAGANIIEYGINQSLGRRQKINPSIKWGTVVNREWGFS